MTSEFDFHPSKRLICLMPQKLGLGGPASFQARLIAGLKKSGVEVTFDPADPAVSAILVVGGTKELGQLRQAKRRGVRIVQRLNGMNWVHRKRYTGIRHFLRAETGNWILSTIRSQLADAIVYQSEFSQRWWNDARGAVKAPGTVVHNGVDLAVYSPAGAEQPPADHYQVLVVEGHLGGGYEQGLKTAVRMTELLNRRMDKPVELTVAGDVPVALRKHFQHAGARIHYLGVIQRGAVPALDRSSHVLFSADVNAACPNSVIEALACGLPVIAYDTGSLRELVTPEAGCIADYGGNVWNLDEPDIFALADCGQKVLENQETFRLGARQRAEQAFSLDSMVEKYLKVLLPE